MRQRPRARIIWRPASTSVVKKSVIASGRCGLFPQQAGDDEERPQDREHSHRQRYEDIERRVDLVDQLNASEFHYSVEVQHGVREAELLEAEVKRCKSDAREHQTGAETA